MVTHFFCCPGYFLTDFLYLYQKVQQLEAKSKQWQGNSSDCSDLMAHSPELVPLPSKYLVFFSALMRKTIMTQRWKRSSAVRNWEWHTRLYSRMKSLGSYTSLLLVISCWEIHRYELCSGLSICHNNACV